MSQRMKIYNVTRWMKVPITVMVKGEVELEHVKSMPDDVFGDWFAEHTDRDEREFFGWGQNYEHVGEQEVELVDEEEDDDGVEGDEGEEARRG